MQTATSSFAEAAFSGVMLFLVFCPSPARLLLLWIEHLRGARFDWQDLAKGVCIHAASTLVSPGLPALLIYQWSQCGPGCGSGVVFIFILPVAWALFFWGNRSLRKAQTQDAASPQGAAD